MGVDTWLRESITNQENVFTKGPNIVWKCRILGSKIEYYFKVCMLILWEWTRGSGGASLIKKMCSTLRIYFWLATHNGVKLFLNSDAIVYSLLQIAIGKSSIWNIEAQLFKTKMYKFSPKSCFFRNYSHPIVFFYLHLLLSQK